MTDQPTPHSPGMIQTMYRGEWILHYACDFTGDVIIRHKEEDRLEIKIPFETLKELVAEASKEARLERLETMKDVTEPEREEAEKIIFGLTVNQLLMIE